MTAPPTTAGMPEMPPEVDFGFYWDSMRMSHRRPRYSAEQMADMYEAGRTAAFEQAAQECDALASIEGIAQLCAAAIRALKGRAP